MSGGMIGAAGRPVRSIRSDRAPRTGDRPAPAHPVRTDLPHSARMYDYYLGGKDNFPADREAAAGVLAAYPATRVTARQLRLFMRRATAHLAAEAGVRQFLDIGTGIPTSPNLHEVAQAVAPDARVVYVDNDPIVLTHARALLTSAPQGRTGFLDADLRDPESIIAAAELRDTLDLARPVALSLLAILHFLPDDDDPYRIVHRLLASLPSGSYLALTHATGDFVPAAVARRGSSIYRDRGIPFRLRSHAEILPFFDGLDLLAPGLTPVHRWRPDGPAGGPAAGGPADAPGAETAGRPTGGPTDAEVSGYGAIARKP